MEIIVPKIDDIDRKILENLRLDGRMTNGALASEIGLSASACLRRVKALERSGTIRGYTAIIAGISSGEGTIAIVQVTLERQTEEYLARFEQAIRRHPEVREWYLMTGLGDYILCLHMAGIEDYERFHKAVLTQLPGVSRITSSFAMRSHARG
jgi:DNA-binding Lrp family transcriptional regulator